MIGKSWLGIATQRQCSPDVKNVEKQPSNGISFGSVKLDNKTSSLFCDAKEGAVLKGKKNEYEFSP